MTRKGLYHITEKVSDHNYRILIKGKEKLFHISILRMYIEREVDTIPIAAIVTDDYCPLNHITEVNIEILPNLELIFMQISTSTFF